MKHIEPGKYLSKAVVYNGVVYVAGQVATNLDASAAEQTREALEKIDAILAQAGTDKTRILSADVWLADIADKDDMNRIWIKWLEGRTPPARAVVQSPLGSPKHKIEIKTIAALPD